MNPSRDLPVLFLISLILSGFWYIGSAITGLLLLVAAVIGCSSVFKRQAWQVYPLSKLMLVYLAWLYIVALNSTVPNNSMMLLAVLAGLPVMYLVGTNIPNFADIWKNLRIFLFIMAVGLAVWAIWQVVNHVGYGHAVGPLVDRNAFAALMNLLWFPAAYLLLTNKSTLSRGMSFFVGGGLFVISLALFATASRGGIATWLLLLPIFLWAGYRHTQSKRFVAIIPLIALLAYVCSALLLHSSVGDRTFQLAQDASTSARLLMWKSTLQMILAHPFIGTGWGTFVNYYSAYRSPLENTTSGFLAHNDYLQLAAEGGLVAMLLQLGLLLGLLFQLKHVLKRKLDIEKFESIALLLGVLALFVQAAVNFIFYFAFMNILAGLYLARAAQLTEASRSLMVYGLTGIRCSVKRLLAVFILLLVATPFGLHLIAQACLAGTQPGLKAIQVIMPNVTAYKLAKFIIALRPQEGIAQEFMLQTSEYVLADNAFLSMNDANVQSEVLKEALERFELVRNQSANAPNIGVREVKILMAFQPVLDAHIVDGDKVFTKATKILNANLKADPYHVNSMIALSRLQVADGHRAEAINTLQRAEHHVLSRRDQQLLAVETLRQMAAPKVFAELDVIEKKLRSVRSDSQTGKPLILPLHFSEDIDVQLKEIAGKIQ